VEDVVKKPSDANENTNGRDDADDMESEGEPLGDMFDLEAWDTQVPPGGFADRVLSRVQAEERAAAPRRSSRVRRWGVITVTTSALALAAAMLVGVNAAPTKGETIARDRIEVAIGSRALAVLESGATVRWDGDDVTQSRGDVFYRVQPGARFTVHTPAGEVEVKGTCFTVKVRAKESTEEESIMQKRDVKSGLVGGALAALAFVAVYEGKVAVSHASEHEDLGPGESAQIGPNGVRKNGVSSEGEAAFNASIAAQGDEPLTNANQRLVRQVGEYRSRLDAITAQRAELEAKLKRSEANLAASQDGSAATKHDYDLSQDDWKELAKEGSIKFQNPCLAGKGEAWSPSPEKLNALGLAPQDGVAIRNAYTHANERVWVSTIRPLCVKEVGSTELADKLGPDNCIFVMMDGENERGSKTGTDKASTMAMREVAEIRAGIRPMPGPNDAVSPLVKVFLATTGAGKGFEDELAQSFGPEEAHRIVYADELCMGRHTYNSSPKKKAK
jgi:hypothetical protein